MRRPLLTWTLAVLAIFGVALVAVAVAFDWNWLRDPLAHYLTRHYGRAVTINGPLSGEFTLRPLLTADDVMIANADWGSESVMGRARRLAVRIDLPSLLSDDVSVPEVTLTDAALLLERAPDGRENWDFGRHAKSVSIGRLAVDAGTVRIRDRERGIEIDANVASMQSGDDGQLTIRFDGKGVWEKNDFAAHGTATTPFARDVRDRPYRLDIEARSGATRATFRGTLVAAQGGKVDGALTLEGSDLAALDAIVPFEFSHTPPYQVTANLRHEKEAWSLRELSAKIGQTDLAGTMAFTRRARRTRVDADLASHAARYEDLRALIGFSGEAMPEPSAQARRTGSKARGRARAGSRGAADAAHAAGSGDLSRLSLVDAKIALKSKRFSIGKWRFENASARIDVHGGVLNMQPVEGTLAGGRVGGTLVIDAREKLAQATVDLTARDVELSEIFPALKKRGSAGKASGRGHLSARGSTARELLESTNGEVAALSTGGTSGVWSSGLSDLDLAQASKLLFRDSGASPIRCAATDLDVKNGVMNVKTLIVDTDDETITGRGSLHLPERRYDLELESQSKTPSLLAYKGPVIVEGSFAHPNVHAKSGPLLARVGAAIGLAVVNPVAGLLPLVDIGGSAGVNCRTLVQKTNGEIRRLKADADGPRGARQQADHAPPRAEHAETAPAPRPGPPPSGAQHPEHPRQPER